MATGTPVLAQTVDRASRTLPKRPVSRLVFPDGQIGNSEVVT